MLGHQAVVRVVPQLPMWLQVVQLLQLRQRQVMAGVWHMETQPAALTWPMFLFSQATHSRSLFQMVSIP